MTSRLTSTQEFTAEELWQPWPEYVAILRDEPERAATITRELFAAKDERLIAFLRSLPWNVDVGEYSPALYASDFPLALLDILTNERWYTLLTSSYYSWFDVFESSLAHELYLVLKFVRRLILIDGGQVLRPGAELCEHYLERFPALWKALWRHREIVLDRSFVKSRGQDEMYALVGYLLECYCSIMEQLRGTVPSISSYAAHVALVIWYKDDGTSTSRPITHHAARIFYEIVQRETSFTRIAFVKETVPLVIGMENSSEVVRRVLSAPGKELLSHWSLHITLTIALLILRGSRPEKKSEEERRETLYALYRAFQRSQCFQITRDESPGTRRNCGAIIHILCTLSVTDEDIMNHDWFDNVDKVDFVQIIALSMRDTCIENDLLGRQTLFSLINGLTRLATRTSTSPEIFRKVAYIRRVLQVHWLPALEELRAVLRQSAQEASPDSTRVVIDLHTMISTWERLGEAYCLSGVSRTHDSVADLTSYLSHEEKTQGCYLTECPCYGRKSPWHKTRLACKGCWAVFYCGRVCQKRDWELGHRDMCPGRRQPARE